jgi:ketosteroid isomerase-like protein
MVMRRALLVLLLLTCACEEKDPVKATIESVLAAAEDRDVDGVMAHISATYPGRAEAEQSLRQYFFGYRTIDISIAKLDISKGDTTAGAALLVKFLGVPKQIGGLDQILPASAEYRFDLQLAKEGDAWKIVAAEWEQSGVRRP